MPTTSAEIIQVEGQRLPFKVVFARNGKLIAEHPVASRDGGRRLVAYLLPLLQKYEDT